MSTILRSLKRLEKETESAAVQEPLLSVLRKRSAIFAGARFKRKALLWALPTAVLVAVAVVFHFSADPNPPQHKIQAEVGQGKPSPQRPVPQDLQGSTAPAGRRQSAAIPAAPQPASSLETPQSHSAGPFDPAAVREALTFDPAQPAPNPPGAAEAGLAMDGQWPHTKTLPSLEASSGTSRTVQPAAALPADAPPVTAPGKVPAPSVRSAPVPAKPGAAQQEDQRYAGAETVTDGRIKVQAIVWCPNADGRMAVVNSRIVREGAVLDGFSIAGIGPEAVYVDEGGKLLKVPFGKN